MDERLYWLGFAVFSGIGPGRFHKLLTYFGSAKDAWTASLSDLQKSKIGDRLAEEFLDFRTKFSPDQYEETLKKKNVSYFLLSDPEYPQLLKQIKNPPFVLFVRGKFRFDAAENQQTIGIVGTRKITEYGKQVTEMLTHELVGAGCVIVSGLALGVDAVAHQTTLDSSGRTVAVLGCGVDCCYPRENQAIYNSILEKGGAIVSEYGLGVLPSKGSFPSRNRLIAGMSLGVLVTEGAAQSGSLITANDALKNDRKVFAVPGPINSSLSSGPSHLIQQGAKLVTSAKDILEELQIDTQVQTDKATKKIKGETEEEQKIIDLLQGEGLHFDELVRRTRIDSSQLGGVLSLLEMKGIIKGLDAGFFCLDKVS
jgi:DNA processing protein